MQDHDRIEIKDSILKLQKTSGTYKDFGKLFYNVSADAFHNYTTILISLFGKEAPDLHFTLAEFYSNIYKGLPPSTSCQTKSGSSNNSTVSYKLINKSNHDWDRYNRAHKYKDYDSKNYEQATWTRRKKKSW